MYLNAQMSVCDVINHFTEDRNAWERKFPNPTNRRHEARTNTVTQYQEMLSSLQARAITRSEYLDVLLFTEQLSQFTRDDSLEQLRNQKLYSRFAWLLRLFQLDDDIRDFQFPQGEAAAVELAAITLDVQALTLTVSELPLDELTDRLCIHLGLASDALSHWWKFIGGYSPDVTWWCSENVSKLQESLQSLRLSLTSHIGDELIGQPVGRDVLEQHLAASWIAHSVDDLIAAAEREWEWCRAQCAAVVNELGV